MSIKDDAQKAIDDLTRIHDTFRAAADHNPLLEARLSEVCRYLEGAIVELQEIATILGQEYH